MQIMKVIFMTCRVSLCLHSHGFKLYNCNYIYIIMCIYCATMATIDMVRCIFCVYTSSKIPNHSIYYINFDQWMYMPDVLPAGIWRFMWNIPLSRMSIHVNLLKRKAHVDNIGIVITQVGIEPKLKQTTSI